jgi:hypothetical protein
MDAINEVQKDGIRQKTIDFEKAGKKEKPQSILKLLFCMKDAELNFLQDATGNFFLPERKREGKRKGDRKEGWRGPTSRMETR